jgi:hypothetical protein
MTFRRVLFLVGVVGLLLASLGFVGVAKRTYRSVRLVAAGATAEGRVVDMRYAKVGSRGSAYAIVAFQAPDGRETRFSSRFSGHGTATLGDRVRVRYDPRDPAQAEIDSFGPLFGSSLIWTVVLCMLLVPVALVLWFTRYGAATTDAQFRRPAGLLRYWPPAG